ncbi:MAG: hypothetical protein AAB955_03435 [Patescibacteria group bacterium]
MSSNEARAFRVSLAALGFVYALVPTLIGVIGAYEIVFEQPLFGTAMMSDEGAAWAAGLGLSIGIPAMIAAIVTILLNPPIDESKSS